jgi:hypothetical protein
MYSMLNRLGDLKMTWKSHDWAGRTRMSAPRTLLQDVPGYIGGCNKEINRKSPLWSRPIRATISNRIACLFSAVKNMLNVPVHNHTTLHEGVESR